MPGEAGFFVPAVLAYGRRDGEVGSPPGFLEPIEELPYKKAGSKLLITHLFPGGE
jgi:hypothetical protein